VRHARVDDLERLAGLVATLRSTAHLTEKRPGVFYWRSKAFLHFHVDADDDLFADVRTDPGGQFERVRVTTKAEQRRLLASVHRALSASRDTTP